MGSGARGHFFRHLLQDAPCFMMSPSDGRAVLLLISGSLLIGVYTFRLGWSFLSFLPHIDGSKPELTATTRVVSDVLPEL